MHFILLRVYRLVVVVSEKSIWNKQKLKNINEDQWRTWRNSLAEAEMTTFSLPITTAARNWYTGSKERSLPLRYYFDLPLMKPCWPSPMASLFSMCLSTDSRKICFLIFSGTKVRLTGLQFLRSFFFPLFKMGVMFSLFHFVGTSPDWHNFSSMMDSGLAFHQVPWNWCTLRFLWLIHPYR